MSNKKQHYVPHFYLKGFATQNGLIVRDLKKGTREIRNPRSVGYGWKYHNVSYDILSRYFELETSINDDYVDVQIKLFHEDIMAKFIKSFEDIQNSLGAITQSDTRIIDTHSFIDIIMVQLYRSPFFNHLLEESNKKHNFKKIDKSQILILYYLLLQSHYSANSVIIKPLFYRDFSWFIRFIVDLKYILSKKEYILILNRTKIPFITSDNPVLYCPSKTSLFSAIYFPVNKGVALVVSDKDKDVNAFSKHSIEIQNKESSIKKWNTNMSYNATRYLFIPNGNNQMEAI